MIIKETKNICDIKAILCNAEIYDTITEDDSPPANEFEPELKGHKYIGGYVNNSIVALMVYHTLNGNDLCHVQVLPNFRKKYAKEFGEQSLKFKGTRSLYAVIPDLYKNVLAFSFLFGFKLIRKTKNTYIKNGKSYDDNILRLK